MFARVLCCIALGALGACSVSADDEEADFDVANLTETAEGPNPCTTATRIRNVSTDSALISALSNAEPGDAIHLADGTYEGKLVADVDGTAEKPIALCGGKGAVLSGSPYGLHVTANNWFLYGFTIANASKGLVLDRASHVVIRSISVHDIEQEGVHFRTFSSDNTIESSTIYAVGKEVPGYGEGVYLGSAKSNWSTYTGGKPDKSDRNRVINNTIGPNVTAESIDIKEGTTGGLISGNTFIGKGMTGENYADSWIDAKGNGYTIVDNSGTDALQDGFQVHQALAGWGLNNVFRKNKAAVNGPGYGFNVAAKDTNTIIGCDNTVTGAKAGFSNIACTPSTSTTILAITAVIASSDDGNVPTNTIDRNYDTRWSAYGDGEWIRFDLGAIKRPSRVKVAFHNGTERVTTFDIQTSTDGTTFNTVRSNVQSSGASTALEGFDFAAVDARWVRIVGHGNTQNAWTSLTEVEIRAAL